MTSTGEVLADVAARMRCETCARFGVDATAAALVVYRVRCDNGHRLPGGVRDFLVCVDHAALLEDATLPDGMVCSGCGAEVGGTPASHVVARVAWIGTP